MLSAFELEKLPLQRALVIRARVAPSGLQDELSRLLPEVFQYALDQQAGVDGMPIARYLSWGGAEAESKPGSRSPALSPATGALSPSNSAPDPPWSPSTPAPTKIFPPRARP
jgi:hypothetical protein